MARPYPAALTSGDTRAARFARTWHRICVPVYRERLWPRPWVWFIPVFLLALLAIAYGAAYGSIWAWVIFIPTTIAALGAIVGLSPTITVTNTDLRVGRAHIPLQLLGEPVVVTPPEMTALLRDGDARTFLAVRTWATRKGVRVEVQDTQDPHGHWLLSTRHPERLHAAIASGAAMHDNTIPPPTRTVEER